MNEIIVFGEVLCRPEIESQLTKIKAQLQKGEFGSVLRCNWTIDMDLEHIFGCHGKWGPKIDGVCLEDKLVWLKEILVVIDELKLKDEDMDKSVFLFVPRTTPADIISRIRLIEQKLRLMHNP